jgi:hypothetical protein
MRRVRFRGYCSAGCGNPIFSRSITAKYCSLSCCRKRFAILRGPCLGCGAPLGRNCKQYCSIRCQKRLRFRKIVEAIESGKYSTLTVTCAMRRYLVEKYGERCTRCGWNERHAVTGRVPIEVEHIDGNWRNNQCSNLTLLCPNCHSLTPTYRGLNRGHGREYRLGGRENPLGSARKGGGSALTTDGKVNSSNIEATSATRSADVAELG